MEVSCAVYRNSFIRQQTTKQVIKMHLRLSTRDMPILFSLPHSAYLTRQYYLLTEGKTH